MKKAEIVIKNYIQRDRNFTIVKDSEGWYMAIEKKYINPDGTLNAKLYGHQMNASKDLNDCLHSTETMVEIDYLESIGHSRAEAFAIYFNLMDKLPELEKAFA